MPTTFSFARVLGLCCILCSVASATQAQSASAGAAPVPVATLVELEQIKVLALSQADSRAVLVFPDKQMVTLTIGQALPRTHAVLTQVMPDKIVLEVAAAGQARQLVWMSRGQGSGPDRIQRFSAASVQQQSHAAPQIAVLNPAQPGAAKPAAPRQP